MLRDEARGQGTSDETWAVEPQRTSWRDVDRALRTLAKQRAALDAEEARWLRLADQLEIWREVACVSMLDYMERRLGYAPRTALDRLRVARALEEVPELADCLAAGELPFSAIRELARVATPETVDAWLEASRDKTVHEIQQSVSGHKRGDRPGDPLDPDLAMRVLRYQVRPSTFALAREAHAKLNGDTGEHLDDDQLVEAFATAVLRAASSRETSGRATHQIAITTCDTCRRGWQHGAGVKVEIDAAALERARCDAQHIGSIDTGEPARATQDVPPRIVRLIHRRDGGRCVVPGCRSAAHLDLHHVVARAAGGTHDPRNLCLCCGAHHRALHDGKLTIRGQAPDRLVFERPSEPSAHTGATASLDHTELRDRARSALVNLGYTRREAAAAVERATAHAGTRPSSLEQWIRDALQQCRSTS